LTRRANAGEVNNVRRPHRDDANGGERFDTLSAATRPHPAGGEVDTGLSVDATGVFTRCSLGALIML
jgi:hypothetical protein